VPSLILIGPPSSDFSGSTDKKLNTAMAARSDPKQFAASFMLEKKMATMHILCAHDLSSVVSFDATEPNKKILEYEPAIKLPNSSSLDSFLEGANGIVGDAFTAAGLGKASGNIDSGNCDEVTKKITEAAYIKLKKYLDGEKMKKIDKLMSNVGCNDGTEQWVSNKNIDAFLTSVEGICAKKEVGDYEVTVLSSMMKKGSVDEFTISNADEHFRTFNFKAPTAPGRCGRFSSRGWGAK